MRGWRRVAVASVLASSASLARVAFADDATVLDTRRHESGSPQNFALEFRGGLYSPRIDDDPALGGQTPYANTFGTSPNLELAAEFDWQVLRIPYVGTLGPGVGLGYTTVSGSTSFIAGKYVGQPAGEQTSLDIYPMYLVAVLRVDSLMKSARVPLVPYVKGGLGYALWVAGNSLGTDVAPNGTVGKGATLGTHFALGISLALDSLDPHAARELDESIGINHTYLFFEYMLSDLNGLGQSHALFVGTHSPEFGLALEF